MTEEDIRETAHIDFYDIGYAARLQKNIQLTLQLRRRIKYELCGSLSIYIEYCHGWREASRNLVIQGDLFA